MGQGKYNVKKKKKVHIKRTQDTGGDFQSQEDEVDVLS